MRLFRLLAVMAALLSPTASFAQAVQPAFKPTGTATLSVSTSSARVALASLGPTALAINIGANPVYVRFGGANVTATTNDVLLSPGCSAAFDVNGQSYMGSITAGSTSSVVVYTGAGIPSLAPSQCNVSVTVTTGGIAAGSPTDRGTTIAVGGTAQTALAANPARKNGVCENPVSATEDLYVSLTGSATVGAGGNMADLAPGGSATIVGATAVSVNAATTGHLFYCTEWQ